MSISNNTDEKKHDVFLMLRLPYTCFEQGLEMWGEEYGAVKGSSFENQLKFHTVAHVWKNCTVHMFSRDLPELRKAAQQRCSMQ